MQTIQPQHLLKFLDITMFILISIASYTMIFQPYPQSSSEPHQINQHKYIIILIMFGYLYYFIKYRLTVYIANNSIYRDKKYYEFHELPKNRAKTFLEEYQLRVQEKSRVEEELKLQESDKQNSFLSYMNRSKLASNSYSRLSNSHLNSNKNVRDGNSRNQTINNDFWFLNNNNNNKQSQNKLMRNSYINKGLQDTKIKNYLTNQQRQQQQLAAIQKNRIQCNAKYVQTLKLHRVPIYGNRDRQVHEYKQLKNLCKKFVKEVYEASISNILGIVNFVEEVYEVRVLCREFGVVQNLVGNGSRANFNKFSMNNTANQQQITLRQILQKLLKSQGNPNTLNLQPRNTPKHPQSQNTPTYFSSNPLQTSLKTSLTLPTELSNKLQTLTKQQLKLNSYFSNGKNNWLSASELFYKLNLLKQYENDQQYFKFRYEVNNNIIQEQYSQVLGIIFDISRNKINDVIGDYRLLLCYKMRSFMGWISSDKLLYQVKQTINTDYGHPHYDLAVNYQDSRKQVYHCAFGIQNGYSVLYMYLLALKEKEVEFVQKNVGLLALISRCL